MSEKPRNSEPSTSAIGEQRPTVDSTKGQVLPPEAEAMTKNSIPPAVVKQMNAAAVPRTKARQQARQLLREGQLEKAEVECRRAMALAPLINGQPWYGDELPLLGDILLAQGDNYGALEYYLGMKTSSKTDDPEHPRPNLNAALAYCRLGNFKMAKKYCPDQVLVNLTDDKSLADWPGTSDLRSLEASVLMVRGFNAASSAQHIEALSYLEPASKLAPKNWLIAYAMSQTLRDLKRPEEAALHYKRAVQYGGDKVPDGRPARVEVRESKEQNAQSAPSAPR